MGQVVTLDSIGALICLPDKCRGRRRQFDIGIAEQLQLIPADDSLCYPLGSSIPCPNSSLFYDYDFFRRKPKCTNINLFEKEEDIDEIYNQLSPDYDFYQVVLVNSGGKNKRSSNRKKKLIPSSKNKLEPRQEFLTSGLFKVPSSFPQNLLNPCRPGSKNGNNFKCKNSFL